MSGSSRSRSRSIRRSRSRDYERRRSNRSRSTSNRGRSHRRSRSTSPLSDRKRHTSDRENPQPSKCLGIFGLSTRTTEADLRDVFDRYPGFLDVKIISDYNTGISRGFGFLNFESYDDARYVKDKCVGMDIDGRNIRIDFSTTTRAHTPTPGRYMGRPSYSGRPRYGGGRERDYGGGRERDYGGGRDRDYGGGRDRDYGGGREREYGGRGNRYNNERRRHSRSYSRSPRRY